MSVHPKINEALNILKDLGLPIAHQNERSALCLLALCDMQPTYLWEQSSQPLMGITPMMDWFKKTMPQIVGKLFGDLLCISL